MKRLWVVLIVSVTLNVLTVMGIIRSERREKEAIEGYSSAVCKYGDAVMQILELRDQNARFSKEIIRIATVHPELFSADTALVRKILGAFPPTIDSALSEGRRHQGKVMENSFQFIDSLPPHFGLKGVI